jgi:hypothetical protein
MSRSRALAPAYLDEESRWKELASGMVLLQDAREGARAVQEDAWQFAVELEQFQRAGVSHTALRWMLRQGYIEQRREQPARGGPRRSFAPCSPLEFVAASCFVVTARGLEFVEGMGLGRAEEPHEVGRPVPCWDAACAALYWRNLLVKEFRQAAANQRLLLTVWQELHWPARMDDPLPPSEGIDSRDRLHDAVRRLNDNRVPHLLRFHCVDCGQGVAWEALEEPQQGPASAP